MEGSEFESSVGLDSKTSMLVNLFDARGFTMNGEYVLMTTGYLWKDAQVVGKCLIMDTSFLPFFLPSFLLFFSPPLCFANVKK